MLSCYAWMSFLYDYSFQFAYIVYWSSNDVLILNLDLLSGYLLISLCKYILEYILVYSTI